MSIREVPHDSRFRPISAWGYVGYTLLFTIPVIGLIFLLWFTFSPRNYNRRSYARAMWCFLLVAVIITAATAAGLFSLLRGSVPKELQAVFSQIRAYVADVAAGNMPLPFLPRVPQAPQNNAPNSATNQPAAEKIGLIFVPTAPPAALFGHTAPPAAPPEGVSAELFAAISSYEAFFDAYIAFMRDYDALAASPAALLRYSEFAAKYIDAMNKMAELEEAPMSRAEETYFARVTLRIYNKLAEAALDD